MRRYIDADALMQEYARFVAPANNSDFAGVPTWNDAVSLLGSAPTADVAEVVRCKDCKYYNHQHHYCDGIGYWFGYEDEWSDNGFCYKGERKEDANSPEV